MGRAQMPLWVQLRRREIERQGEEEVTDGVTAADAT